jgi:hypothetical protein
MVMLSTATVWSCSSSWCRFCSATDILQLAPPEPGEPDDSGRPIAVAFDGEHRLLVQFPTTLQHIDLHTGTVLRTIDGTDQLLRGIWRGHALFSHPHGQWREDDLVAGVAVLDLRHGTHCTTPPVEMPITTVNKDQPEDAWLEDWRTGRTAPVYEDCSGDRAQEVARSPDLRFVWVSSAPDDGAIQSLDTAEPHLLVSRLRLHDQLPEGVDPEDDEAGDDEWVKPAFARGPGNLWHILDAMGGVSVDGSVRFRVPPNTLAGAFSLDGTLLAVAFPSAVTVLRVPSGEVVVEHPLVAANAPA